MKWRMSKKFIFKYEDTSPRNLTYEIGESARLRIVQLPEQGPLISGNSEGLLALAKILVMMANGSYEDGFHLHFRQDFDTDADKPDIFAVAIAKNFE
jgi:hypothetical protein